MREAATCPPRETTVTGDQSNTATLTVASAAPFRVGYTLTIPQTNADGTITTTTRVITNIAGNTLTLATAVATDGRPEGRQRRDRQPGLRHREPDAVRRVAGPGDGRRRRCDSARAAARAAG